MPELKQLLLTEVVPDPNQPRKYYDEVALNELVQSISTDDVIQPILVRPAAKGKYMIVCGERRFRASKLAGKEDIPAVVREMSDNEALQLQIVENLLRKDVHPIEEATAFKSLAEKYSAEEIATRVGKSTGYVVKRIKLADLVPDAQDIYFRNLIEMKHAQLLCRLTPEEQQAVIDEVATRDKKSNKIKEVSGWRLENSCTDTMASLDRVPFKTNDAKLYPEAGACTKCPHNTANSPLLFDDMKGKHCTKLVCFNIKVMRTEQAKLEELAADPNRVVIVGSSYLNKEQQAKLDAAKEMGINILEDKMWDNYYEPDQETLSYQDWLDAGYGNSEDRDEYDDDKEHEDAIEENQEDYKGYVEENEASLKELASLKAQGLVVEAYVLLGHNAGQTRLIKLKPAARELVAASTGNAGDQEVLSEIAKIELRESRAQQLDREKIFTAAIPEFENYEPRLSLEWEDKIAMIIMLADSSYDVRQFISERLNLKESDYSFMSHFNALSGMMGVDVGYLFAQVVSVYLKDKMPAKDFRDYKRHGKAAAYMQIFERMMPNELAVQAKPITEKAEKRQANVTKRIEALRKKLTTEA